MDVTFDVAFDSDVFGPDICLDATAFTDREARRVMDRTFDRALDHVYDQLGIGADYVRLRGGSCFTREVHVNYLRELSAGDPIRVTFQLLDWDAKRMHFFEEMYHAEQGYLAATSEQLALHVVDLRDEERMIARIRSRLEAPLRAMETV